jgi:hypothetical protein
MKQLQNFVRTHKVHLQEFDERSITYSTNVNAIDRTITQAVSRRNPTAGALVRAQVRSCAICG